MSRRRQDDEDTRAYVMTAKDGADDLPVGFGDSAQAGVPREKGCHPFKGVRFGQADTIASLPQAPDLGIVSDIHRANIAIDSEHEVEVTRRDG